MTYSSLSGEDVHLHHHPWNDGSDCVDSEVADEAYPSPEGSGAVGAGQCCWQSWGSGDAACPGFAHFPLVFGCLDAVLLLGSGSLWDSTTPSWPVLSEGPHETGSMFAMETFNHASWCPWSVSFGCRGSVLQSAVHHRGYVYLTFWWCDQPSGVVIPAVLCGHWTCRSTLWSLSGTLSCHLTFSSLRRQQRWKRLSFFACRW